MSLKTGMIAAALVASLAVLTPVPAIAAGGGGGAPSTPNVEARSVDVGKAYQQGVDALQTQNYKLAERSFRDVLSVVEKDANANFMMALAKIGLEKPKDARRYLRTAVKTDPELAEARGYLGAIETQLGEAEKAAEQTAALEAMKSACGGSCPKAQDIDAALARIQAAQAKPAASLLDGARLAAHISKPQGESAYLSAYGAINEGRYLEALPELASAAAVFGPHPDILTYQGFANRKLGRFETALGYYKAALALDPDHLGANQYLGEFYVERGQMSLARRQLAKLDGLCTFGCEEAEELRRWVAQSAS